MRQIAWTLALLVPLSLSLAAQSPTHRHPAPAGPGDAGGQHARYDDLKWQIMVPELGADGPQAAILRVDPKTGATQLLIRMPKRMHVPVHWHSANETHTVIKGTMVFEHGGQPHELGPGGFNYIPARTPHQAWSATDDALVFITVDGPWDVNWVNGPPNASHLGQGPPSN
jgi:mannose-6-phosphate isomerase-like protein (cupin superfamily)